MVFQFSMHPTVLHICQMDPQQIESRKIFNVF